MKTLEQLLKDCLLEEAIKEVKTPATTDTQEIEYYLAVVPVEEIIQKLAQKLQEKGILLPSTQNTEKLAEEYVQKKGIIYPHSSYAEEHFLAGWQAREQAS